jgi:hypothetical protein
MIQPLRTVHRRVSVVMAVFLPTVLFVGLTARRPVSRPGGGAVGLPDRAHLLKQTAGGWQRHTIQTSLYGQLDPPHDIYAVLNPARPLNAPDVLVYWSGLSAADSNLPSGARLLGTFEPARAIVLPRDLQPGGNLILYSLAHQSVVDSAPLESLP